MMTQNPQKIYYICDDSRLPKVEWFIVKGIVQIFESQNEKCYPPRILVLAFPVTLVVSDWLYGPKNGRKTNFKMKGGTQIELEKLRISLSVRDD